MIKNIMLLTKISTKNIFETFNIFNKENKKINKKSIYVWLFFIVAIAITYLSNEFLNFLDDYGQINIFLEVIFLLIMIIMFMQTIISCMNVLYFSKDIEYFLMFPIKTKELLLSRINTMLNTLYFTEAVFLLIPLILYGIFTMANYSYYLYMVLVLILLPIFPVLLVSIIFLVIMKFVKKIKNKNKFQIITTLFFIAIIILLEFIFIKGVISNNLNYEQIGMNFKHILDNINKSIIVINPLINILEQNNLIINLLEVLGIYTVMYAVLIWIGNKVYIANILKKMEYHKPKTKEKVNLEQECRLQNKAKAYIKNDFKSLYGNTTFFLQILYPVLMIILMIVIIGISVRFQVIEKNQELYNLVNGLNINLEGVCFTIGVAQVLFSFVNISISAISRQGKNAIFMKYIPINMYQQFLLKNIPQVFFSSIISIILLLMVKIIFISITWTNIICMLPICLIIGILNSYIMLIVDIKHPIINWNTEIEVLKQNENKIFQYVWTIIVILLLMYIERIFEDINLYVAMLITFVFFTLLLIIIDLFVRKQIKKNNLFKKII